VIGRLIASALIAAASIAVPPARADSVHRHVSDIAGRMHHSVRTMLRLSMYMSPAGKRGAGIISVTVRSQGTSERFTLRATHRVFEVPLRAGVVLLERPAAPAHWVFQQWRVAIRGDAAYQALGPQLSLSMRGAATVRADFVERPKPISPPNSTPVAVLSPVPTLTAAAPTLNPTPTQTIEPICRSWHPVPRCRFPTGTAVSRPTTS
jgi:hypothetical protein